MKDELGGVIMTEFIALRTKLYSYKGLNGAESKKCKGIKKCVVKKHSHLRIISPASSIPILSIDPN